MVVPFRTDRASVALRRRRLGAFGWNDHELGDRIAHEREVETELEPYFPQVADRISA